MPRNVERALYARCGGYCSNPDCRADLILTTEGGRAIAIGELAHVIAWSPMGPRGRERGLTEDVDRIENLVMLCPTCHTVVDAAPEEFPVEALVEWRESRASRIRVVAETPIYGSRDEVVAVLRELLLANKAIHAQYGPEGDLARDPLSTGVESWRREVIGNVLPNNRRIIELGEANRDVLDGEDLAALAEFKVHADGFAYNHLSGDKDPYVPTFPDSMRHRFENDS